MWSEEFDKKAQDAAQNHSPTYDGRNWDKMQSLLDKHLPVEKKKRRFIFWWILPVFLGITAYIYFSFDKSNRNSQSITNNKQVIEENKSGSSSKMENAPTLSSGAAIDPDKTNDKEAIKESPTDDNKLMSGGGEASESIKSETTRISNIDETSTSPSANPSRRQRTGTKNRKNIASTNPEPVVYQTAIIADQSLATKPAATENNLSPSHTNSETEITKKPESIESLTESKVADSSISKTTVEEVPIKPSTKKSGKSRDKGFFAGLSFGPDISGFDMEEGKWQFQYGVTAGYAFSKHWSVRSGFLAARKIYTAAPSDYHPPYDLMQYYPGIQKIDADCYVIEIPLTAVYSFATSKKQNWFVSTGLSSYLMKEETYEYYYKNAAGQMEKRTRNFENENSHLFSIFNFSGGYKYQFSNRIFLMAEPYLKIPLSGVGYGNVKLNSAGVLFTVGAKF